MQIQAFIGRGSPNDLFFAFELPEFSSGFWNVLGKLGINSPNALEHAVQPSVWIAPTPGDIGYEVRVVLSGVSRLNGRTSKMYHDTLKALKKLVIETVLTVMVSESIDARVVVMVEMILDAAIETYPSSGIWSNEIDVVGPRDSSRVIVYSDGFNVAPGLYSEDD